MFPRRLGFAVISVPERVRASLQKVSMTDLAFSSSRWQLLTR